ncbi:amidohydrolase family protein|uniref:amidohydrolase family protein n=1 Tax=Pseudomonas sp. SbOxS1 TaxID=2723884 RepID=UPI0015D41F2A|nr:amidohydrolase family protein [Pseudomonas sp. SbOxS1]NYU04876.1 amidohydrolase family protein [Pseudomonas sp. SbOxS1]
MDEIEVRTLPTEVELVLDVMPCQGLRRTYDSGSAPHPCGHFAEWGLHHSFDYAKSGPPPAPGVIQSAVYRGKRPLLPEVLSGCRKAPIMCVGINPNLPSWWDHNALNPYFEDYLQYAHYFRYRSTAKLRMPEAAYAAALAGRQDGPGVAEPLMPEGTEIPVELHPVTMYLAYQSLLDGLADAEGWPAGKLVVGEDLSYANMVACPSARWTSRPNPQAPDLPLMGAKREQGIVSECFYERTHFLRQLLQSLPAVILVFSATTARPFITALKTHFSPQGAPSPDEDLDQLAQREIRLQYGHLADGTLLDARVLFMPHASANPAQFKVALPKTIEQLRQEVAAGRIRFRPQTGRLERPRGGCVFCTNELYRIGPCDYRAELRPLEVGAVGPLDAAAAVPPDPLTERTTQERLLADFMAPPRPGLEVQALDAAAPSAPPLILFGKVVPMAGDPIPNGAVYLKAGLIVAVQDRDAPPPPSFEAAAKIETAGVIVPGLLDLHNHLAYNILPLWNANRRFDNRSQWQGLTDYRRFISIPMTILAKERKDLIKPIVRYVEAKLLMGGVTSGQGMHSRFRGESLYRGIVRNFEVTGDPHLKAARHRVGDLTDQPEDLVDFRGLINSGAPFFFHLAEGADAKAHRQFELLEAHNLISEKMLAIHCVGLKRPDFDRLAEAGAKVVWSPLSNLLLYGQTLNLKAVLDSGVSLSLGSDWTPSGSRNILLEMKVARRVADAQGADLTDRAIAEGVTVKAAQAAGWGEKLGVLAAGRYADLLVVDDKGGDPYSSLVAATEANVRLVVVAGHARYGDADLMTTAGIAPAAGEATTVGGRAKRLNLNHPASPLNNVTLDFARSILADEMSDIQRARSRAAFFPLADEPAEIELDLQADDEFAALAEVAPVASIILDTLTIVDDPGYFGRLATFAHLPDFLTDEDGVSQYYSQ